MFTKDEGGGLHYGRITAACLGTLFFTIFLLFGIGAGCKTYERYQKRADAHNNVSVTREQIKVAEEEAKVNKAQIKATEAEAEKRVAESVGIKEAQVEINKTLTPLYVQHEFVQAIEKGHVEVSLIPVGAQGLPLVGNTELGGGR